MAGESALYGSIIVSGEPRGNKIPVVIDGTPKPGTIMQIKAATAKEGGKYTAEVYNRDASGNNPQGPIMVLVENYLAGGTINTAYADGDWAWCYCPIPGDELLCLVKNIAGTETFAIGDIMIPEDGSGLLIDTASTPEVEPFILLEADTTVWSADTLMHVMFTGY